MRLYPPYIAALALTVVALVAARLVFGTRYGAFVLGYDDAAALATDVGVHIALLQNFGDASARLRNGPFWTLALEGQLYFLYFALLALRRRGGWMLALGVSATVTMAWRATPLTFAGLPDYWYALGPTRWIEWALGALAVEAYLGQVKLPAWCLNGHLLVASLGGAALLASPFSPEPLRSLFTDPSFGLAFFVATNVAVRHLPKAGAGRAVNLLAAIGLFSYSIYLTHVPVLSAVK